MKSILYGLLLFGILTALELLNALGSKRLIVEEVQLHSQELYAQMHQSVEVVRLPAGYPVIVMKETVDPRSIQLAAVIGVIVAMGHWVIAGKNPKKLTEPKPGAYDDKPRGSG